MFYYSIQKSEIIYIVQGNKILKRVIYSEIYNHVLGRHFGLWHLKNVLSVLYLSVIYFAILRLLKFYKMKCRTVEVHL